MEEKIGGNTLLEKLLEVEETLTACRETTSGIKDYRKSISEHSKRIINQTKQKIMEPGIILEDKGTNTLCNGSSVAGLLVIENKVQDIHKLLLDFNVKQQINSSGSRSFLHYFKVWIMTALFNLILLIVLSKLPVRIETMYGSDIV